MNGVFNKILLAGTFLTWTDANTSSTLNYIKDLILDLSPLLIPIIAISLGLFIFAVVVNTLRGK